MDGFPVYSFFCKNSWYTDSFGLTSAVFIVRTVLNGDTVDQFNQELHWLE